MLAEAVGGYREVLRFQPEHPVALCYLGVGMGQMGRFQDALGYLIQAQALAPDFVDAHINLGKAFEELGRFEDAATNYRRALKLEPGIPEIHFNLGKVLHNLGRLDEAEVCYRQVLQLRSTHVQAWLNLGIVLKDQGRAEAAVDCYRKALANSPDLAEAHNNLGNALRMLGRPDDAIASFLRALELKPDFAEAHNNLGMLHLDRGQPAVAIGHFRRVLALNPDFLDAFSNLLFARNYQAELSPVHALVEACEYGARLLEKASPYRAWKLLAVPDKRLRVGLVSGDLRNHPVAYFLEAALATLDAEQIELYAYATTSLEDGMTERLKPHFRRWTRVIGLSDSALAARIHEDGIDILIDLAGHTADNRLPALAWKPAPVQVSWLGYFATTGVPGMDYLLADSWVVPADESVHFSETVWRLPEIYYCFTPPDVAIEVGPLPAIGSGHITFGCFNKLAKMNDGVVRVWSQVLHALPAAKLMLKAKELGDAGQRAAVLQRYARHGITPGRLILEGVSPRAEYLAAYGQVDIALDPFPYPGGTTTVEGLWMGVPALTLKGDRFIGHQGETILHNAGLDDWIARDEDDYVAKAVAFAGDFAALAELRGRLREQLLASPVCDAPRFARHFETALRGMWTHWCAQRGCAGQMEKSDD